MTKAQQYITLAFRVAFPQAGVIAVGFDDFTETWIVAIDHKENSRLGGLCLYTMTIGSDDDEFRFRCITDPKREVVAFPIPEGLDQ